MAPASATTARLTTHADRRRWPRRLAGHPALAGLIAASLYLSAYAALPHMTWQEAPPQHRIQVAEAWLGANMASAPRPSAPSPPAPKAPPAEAPTPLGLVSQASGVATSDNQLALLLDVIAGSDDPSASIMPPDEPAPLTAGPGLATAGGGEGTPGFAGVAAGVRGSAFFGQRGDAYKIVYVIDTSGSLGWMFEPVQHALIESIDHLRPTQSFHVIFAGQTPVELPERKLVPAIAYYKEPAEKFIRELVPAMQCDIVAAMQRAFAVQPELIYLLTDGDFGLAGSDLLERLNKWNADRTVRITTIGFGVRLERTEVAGRPVGESLLREIAREHGGNFRWVSPDDE